MTSTRLILTMPLLILLVSGCATTAHISRLPKPEEFKKPLAELKREYPDLTKFESPSLFVTILELPEAAPLKQAWDEPHRRGFTAWMLLPPMWLFHPSNYWYWDFAGKEVSALIDRPIGFGYRPHVWKLKVKEKGER